MNAKNTVKFELNAAQPAVLTPAQRKRLQKLAKSSDRAIDYSDIARSPTTVAWSRPHALVPAEPKLQITLRLDADVVAFFKRTGVKYQSRINAALREYVGAHNGL